ncbi:hypothetical protein Q8F55_005655 [Vanrija albida]|uniref:GDP/GTP exchange factor Sec2 N-terminal domain-containing protein n=1 Tax=Vanrija albida TaxID=181172 RepID=A0ABR3Q315_9TREE
MLNRLRQSVYHAPSASLPGTSDEPRSPTRIKTWPALPGLWGDGMASGSGSSSGSPTPRPTRTPHASVSSAPPTPRPRQQDPATAAAMQAFAAELGAIKAALETRDDECENLRRRLEQVDAYKAQLEDEVRRLRAVRTSSVASSASPTTPSSAVMPLTPGSDGSRAEAVEMASDASSAAYPARSYTPVPLLPPPKRRSLEAKRELRPLEIAAAGAGAGEVEAARAVTPPAVTSPSPKAPSLPSSAASPPPTPPAKTQLPSSWLSTARAQQELMSHHTAQHAGSASDEMIQALQDMLDTVPAGVTLGNQGPLLVLFEREVSRREAADRKVAREIYRRVTVEGQLAVALHRAAVLERQVAVRDAQLEVAEVRQEAAERDQHKAEHDLALIKSQFDFIEARLRGYMVQERTRPGFDSPPVSSPPPPPPTPAPASPATPTRLLRNTLTSRMAGALGQSGTAPQH